MTIVSRRCDEHHCRRCDLGLHALDEFCTYPLPWHAADAIVGGVRAIDSWAGEPQLSESDARDAMWLTGVLADNLPVSLTAEVTLVGEQWLVSVIPTYSGKGSVAIVPREIVDGRNVMAVMAAVNNPGMYGANCRKSGGPGCRCSYCRALAITDEITYDIDGLMAHVNLEIAKQNLGVPTVEITPPFSVGPPDRAKVEASDTQPPDPPPETERAPCPCGSRSGVHKVDCANTYPGVGEAVRCYSCGRPTRSDIRCPWCDSSQPPRAA